MTELVTRFQETSMPRRPEPWYWSKRKGWYVQLDGKQILLGKADKRTPNPPPEIQKEWHRLMAVGNRLSDEERRRTTVPELVEVFLEWKAKTRRASTIRRYEYILLPFATRYKNRRVSDIHPHDVLDFAAGQATWGDSTRFIFVGLVVTAWRYARDRGYFDANPLVDIDNPYRMQVREHAMTTEEFLLVRNLRDDAEWRFVMDVLWHTGARPGEVCKIEGRHLHPTEPKATLGAKEHKTGRMSGRNRVIYFPDEIMAELRKMAVERPTGPLLVNQQGNPWRALSIAMQFLRWRKRGKIPKHLVLYSARHGFVTRKIAEGHHPSLVSKAVGHAHSRVTEGVYFNPASEALGKVAKSDIRAAVQAEVEKGKVDGSIDVEGLVQTIVDGVVARMVVNRPPTVPPAS
jgi:integrase